jgi:hypothetical protein
VEALDRPLLRGAVVGGDGHLDRRAGRIAIRREPGQEVLDLGDHVGQLRPDVLGLGKAEAEQPVPAELAHGPQIRLHTHLALPGVRNGSAGSSCDGRVQRDTPEWPRRQTESSVLVFGFLVELCVRLVEPQQVFTLHVEDQCFRVDRIRP